MSEPSFNCAHDNAAKQVPLKCLLRAAAGYATIFHRADGAR